MLIANYDNLRNCAETDNLKKKKRTYQINPVGKTLTVIQIIQD